MLKLTRTGTMALVLDKPLSIRWASTPTAAQVSTDGQVIVISPVRAALYGKLKAIVAEAHAKYGGVFRRLAE
jgi:hypothetical protein